MDGRVDVGKTMLSDATKKSEKLKSLKVPKTYIVLIHPFGLPDILTPQPNIIIKFIPVRSVRFFRYMDGFHGRSTCTYMKAL